MFILAIPFTISHMNAPSHVVDVDRMTPRPPVVLSFDEMMLSKVESAGYTKDHLEHLARVIFSETKRLDEAEAVGWFIRNRVDTGYRGESTYWGVIHDPSQFSAYNDADLRTMYGALTLKTAMDSTAQRFYPTWRGTIRVAADVLAAREVPYDSECRHFYTPSAMKNGKAPFWAAGKRADVKVGRFRFYCGVK